MIMALVKYMYLSYIWSRENKQVIQHNTNSIPVKHYRLLVSLQYKKHLLSYIKDLRTEVEVHLYLGRISRI